MPDKAIHQLSEAEQGRLARYVMRRQGALSLRVASVFFVLIVGIPLGNYFLPAWANAPIAGFTVTWFFLGVVIYPITIGLSAYFVKKSDAIEAECADWRKALIEEEAR